MPTAQDILIGNHPAKPNFFAEWLDFVDEPVPAADPNKKHRKLSEVAGKRSLAIRGIAQYLLDQSTSRPALQAGYRNLPN